MSTQDFTTTLVVDQTPREVFNAINNVRGWWSGQIEGPTHELNDEFSYRYKDFHYSKHKLIEVVPDKKIVWLITDSNLNSFTDKNEWNGTKISFEITEKDGKTYVRFTHWGLVPQIECFGACSNAWTGYITQSLRDLIVTGRGWPAQHA
ncbi:MAG: SRPBCC domain-containing protein [Sediminibacterium magnilacihabitans]|jgi:hypothetical protein|nr:SRPBCC domain-containing protein [Sediminibacterium magnilacihabitans]PQV61237.1 uncharacterized protein YndB with AHSA1/START domain [Sediminibacterium magnilacihabitans]